MHILISMMVYVIKSKTDSITQSSKKVRTMKVQKSLNSVKAGNLESFMVGGMARIWILKIPVFQYSVFPTGLHSVTFMWQILS